MTQRITTIPSYDQGLHLARYLWPANVTGVNIKASAGQIQWLYLENTAAAVRYVKFSDLATAPVTGTTIPVLTIGLPATSAFPLGIPNGLQFANGIGIAVTNLAVDTDTTAPTLGDVILNIGWY
jgi:hypothetical protein